jgi:exopolyphosphatase/guanosine-5'-triphosphate,3'-diphosphate pyrophosphatase
MYVRVDSHHRHAAYLIMAAPLLSLSPQDKILLAQTVRYQRKGAPSESHEGFAALDKTDKQKVWHMSALLRLAIALNKDRRDRVNRVAVEIAEDMITLHLEGAGDLLLERWSVLKLSGYIKQAFNLKLNIDLES